MAVAPTATIDPRSRGIEPAAPHGAMSKPGAWEALRSRLAREQTMLVSFVVLYCALGRLGLALSYGHPSATLIWPSSGLALGALLTLGYRIWPAIFCAAAVVYASILGPLPAVLLMAAGHTLESVLAGYLVNRYAEGRHALQSPANSFRFAGIALLVSTASGPTINAIGLVATGNASGTRYGEIWLALSQGSFLGMLVVTPLVLLFSQGRERWRPAQIVEGTIVFVTLLLTGFIAFFEFPIRLLGFPNELLVMPVLLWAVFRLGRRAAACALAIVSVIVVAGTLSNYGPFMRDTPFSSLLNVEVFLAGLAVMTMSLAALASEYSVAEAQLRELVVTDPLTGLPNYRRLLEVLQMEIARADRHNRQFAVVFFDMDGLKRINDEMGHLAGSRAVCRFAETLRAACRETDTPARYGGDEFVAVLSDTDLDGAKLVVKRTNERLAEDTDHPRLAVSAGIAVYPRDGGTPTTLLSAADRALYANKADKANARRRSVVEIREWTNAG
jgi:diguanylate cyclase (GGDEF)-like protein